MIGFIDLFYGIMNGQVFFCRFFFFIETSVLVERSVGNMR